MQPDQPSACRAERDFRSVAVAAFVPGLLFLSGASGLFYEVIWFKRFSQLWGNSSAAAAAVVAAFLGGLAIGARLFGSWTRNFASPLRVYGMCEIGIGLTALLIPYELSLLRLWNPAYSPAAAGHPAALFIARLILAGIALAPPCVLMGATLPLLVSYYSPQRGSTRPLGWLYGVNTLGAAFGCALAGFFVLPWLGLYLGNLVAAATNLIVGSILVIARWKTSASDSASNELDSRAIQRTPASGAVESSAIGVPQLLYAAFASGCAALVLEMLWMRQLSLILGGSTYAFTAMLAVILAGIAVGGLIYDCWAQFFPPVTFTAATVVGLCAATVAGKLLIPSITDAVSCVRDLRASAIWNGAVCVITSVVLEFFPAVGMGCLLPALTRLRECRAHSAHSVVGTMVAWNTCGALVGAAVTTNLVMPLWGSATAFAAAILLYVSVGIAVIPSRERLAPISGLALSLAGSAAVAFALQPTDPLRTDMGGYLYGYVSRRPVQALAGLQSAGATEVNVTSSATPESTVLYFREGAASNVLVVGQGNRKSLRVNGKVDASNHGDMATQLGSAYVPRFLRPSAKNIAVIGFGSGSTAGASLLFPETQVTCCEIEPAVVGASSHFADVNHAPESSPNFRVIYDDGRAFLESSRERFDIIISEPSNPWMAGVGNLYTREFFATARTCLGDEGILCQWLQLYQLSMADYVGILRTLAQVFPHTAALRIDDGDTLILASGSPILPDARVLDMAQRSVARPEIASDLRRYFGSTEVRELLAGRLLWDDSALRSVVNEFPSAEPNTDASLRLEFDAPGRLFQKRSDVSRELLRYISPRSIVAQCRAFGLEPQRRAEPLIYVANLLRGHALVAQLRQLTDEALIYVPDSQFFTAERLAAMSVESSDEFASASAVLTLPGEMNRAAVLLWRGGHPTDAAALLQRVVRDVPTSATAWSNLGICLRDAKDAAQSAQAFEKAAMLDPFAQFPATGAGRHDYAP